MAYPVRDPVRTLPAVDRRPCQLTSIANDWETARLFEHFLEGASRRRTETVPRPSQLRTATRHRTGTGWGN